MDSGGPDPGCDLPCQTKIIINGGNASRILESTCEGLQHFFNNGGKLKQRQQILALLNEIEDKTVELQQLVIRVGVGYTGPVGKMLS